jgi:hypothetical protein
MKNGRTIRMRRSSTRIIEPANTLNPQTASTAKIDASPIYANDFCRSPVRRHPSTTTTLTSRHGTTKQPAELQRDAFHIFIPLTFRHIFHCATKRTTRYYLPSSKPYTKPAATCQTALAVPEPSASSPPYRTPTSKTRKKRVRSLHLILVLDSGLTHMQR